MSATKVVKNDIPVQVNFVVAADWLPFDACFDPVGLACGEAVVGIEGSGVVRICACCEGFRVPATEVAGERVGSSTGDAFGDAVGAGVMLIAHCVTSK